MATIVVKKHADDANKLTLGGIIIAQRASKRAITMTMRVTSKRGNRVYVDHPTVLVFDEKAMEQATHIPLRTPVIIEGYVTSRKQEPVNKDAAAKQEAPNAPARPMQSFVATSFRLPKDDEDINQNEVELVGAVDRAFVQRGGLVNLIIVSFRDGRYMKRIRVECFPKDGVNYIEYMASGTRVKVKGHVTTSERETDTGVSRTMEYIVCDEIDRA